MGWTRQAPILPVAMRLLRGASASGRQPGGQIVSLIKPDYESSERQLVHGVLRSEEVGNVLRRLRAAVRDSGLELVGQIVSPAKGQGGNTEYLWRLRPASRPCDGIDA